jgi:hypothetical protein
MLSNNVLSYKPRAIVFLNKLKFLRWQQKSTDNVAAIEDGLISSSSDLDTDMCLTDLNECLEPWDKTATNRNLQRSPSTNK